MGMTCHDICRDLPALLDEDLSPRRRKEVEDHLATCPSCTCTHAEYARLINQCDDATAYDGPRLSFESLRTRMATIEPLDEIIRYQLPKLQIPGTVPRFAVAMALLVSIAGPSYACRHARDVYVAARTPFADQEATVVAALDDGHFPWDEETEAAAKSDTDQA